jgi:hypothetical protein
MTGPPSKRRLVINSISEKEVKPFSEESLLRTQAFTVKLAKIFGDLKTTVSRAGQDDSATCR